MLLCGGKQVLPKGYSTQSDILSEMGKIMKRKAFALLLAVCVAVSGCKKSPNDMTSETSTHTAMSPDMLWADYSPESTDSVVIGENETETHIDRKLTVRCVLEKSEKRTITFDLDLPEKPTGKAYTYDTIKDPNYSFDTILSAFYGERAKDFVPYDGDGEHAYHNGSDGKDNSIAAFKRRYLYLTLDDAAALCPLGSNMLQSAEEMDIKYSESEAIGLCDKFLDDCGITGYKHFYTTYFGAEEEPFYLIRYYYDLNSLPAHSLISDNKGLSYISFYVDNDGLVQIKANLYDENSFQDEKEIDLSTIISSQEAIESVEKQAAEIRLGNELPIFDEYFSEKGEGLLYVPVCKMELGYWFSEHEGYRLAWVFFIGENGNIDNSATFAIDALTGKLCEK